MITRPALLVLLALATTASAQSTWYVDVAGTPPGSGTHADPFTSIQYALDQATTLDGDTLSVAPGVYLENVVLARRVRVEGRNGADATILRAAVPGTVLRSESYQSGSNIPTLVGFTVDGTGDESGTGVHVASGFELRMEHCLVRELASGTGLRLGGSAFADLFQVTISRNAVGVSVDPTIHTGQATLIGCILRGNGTDFVDGSGIGMNPFFSCVPPELLGPGTGNFANLPRFWNHPAGDLHLGPGSPCIDAAAGSGLPPDPDGSPPDAGALPFDPGYAWGPHTYCTAKPASAGCLASVSATGTASASGATGFTVSAHDVLSNKIGLAFYGFEPQELPFQGGTLCVKGGVRRLAAQGSGGNPPPDDCSGSYTLDFGAWLASGSDPLLVAGELVYLQFWYRDPLDPAGWGSALSDALGFGIAP